MSRHAVTETPAVKAALDELRKELGSDRVNLGELVILGARQKSERLWAERDRTVAARRRLADRIRSGTLPEVGITDPRKREIGVLHYDRDYDLIAEKTDLRFESVWLAEPGSL